MIARLGPKFRQIQGGTVVPLAPPPILGLGTGGGFTYVLQDLRGGDPKALAQVLRGLVVAANQDPQLSRVFSTFSATNPSIYLDIDRDKAQILGVQLSDVFQALQASLGGYFVNNMNLFGRTWQVQVQAEAADRSSDRRHLSHQRAQRRGEDDSAAQPGGGARRGRPAGADPLQQPPRRDRPGRPRAGHFVGAGAEGDGSRSRRRRCRRAMPANGPIPRSRRSAPRARPRSSSASPCCSPICSWSRSMRAGPFRSRCCCRSRSACSDRSPRSCSAG